MKSIIDHKQILNKFKQKLLIKFKDDLISLVLFGSAARGTAKKESDIDMLIILKDAPDSYYGMILSLDEAKQNRNIFLDMIDHSVILHDTNNFFKNRLSELKKRLDKLGSKKVLLDGDTWYWSLKPDIVAGEIIEL